MTDIFYCPRNAAVGDVIPYYANGEFKLFYLQIWRVPEELRGATDLMIVLFSTC